MIDAFEFATGSLFRVPGSGAPHYTYAKDVSALPRRREMCTQETEVGANGPMGMYSEIGATANRPGKGRIGGLYVTDGI